MRFFLSLLVKQIIPSFRAKKKLLRWTADGDKQKKSFSIMIHSPISNLWSYKLISLPNFVHYHLLRYYIPNLLFTFLDTCWAYRNLRRMTIHPLPSVISRYRILIYFQADSNVKTVRFNAPTQHNLKFLERSDSIVVVKKFS